MALTVLAQPIFGMTLPGIIFNMKQKGFTFIELLLYIAILSIILTSLVTFAWNAIDNSGKSTTQQEIASNARFVSERLLYEIRKAVDINTATSNFGINLATDQTKQLSLKENAPNDPTLINVVSGKIQIKQGAAAAVALNSTDTTVTDLTFTNNSSGDGKTKNITYTLTIISNFNQSRQEFQGTISLRASGELRNN